MEVTRTVRVKLSVPDERREDLQETIRQFARAANYTVEHAKNEDGYFILDRTELHDQVYYELREETDLTANLCIRAYSRALRALKTTVTYWKRGKRRQIPEFSPSSVVYDKDTLTIKDRYATLSTVNGRVKATYVLGDYQRSYLDDGDYERRMGTLHYREDQDTFYLNIVIQKEVKPREGNRVLGVDMNLENVAVTSTGEFYDGGRLLWTRTRFAKIRESLQRRIVEEARDHDCAYIAIEELSHIRDRMDSPNPRLQRNLHQWAFRELGTQIEYKAAEFGIQVVSVDPAYTSQTCSVCGHCSSTNRQNDGWFECEDCGYSVDGDYNAAKNVGLRLLTLPEGERPSGLGDGHLALKSGTVTPTGHYTPDDSDESIEEESHGQTCLDG